MNLFVRPILYLILLCISLTSHAIASPKIVVVGAGLAGLTTAYRLNQMGYDVEVYEARNRLGGRVFTVKVKGHIVELGGQSLLDGGDGEETLALVDELGLKTETLEFPLHVRYFDNDNLIDAESLLKKYAFTPNSLEEKLSVIAQTSHNMQEVLNVLFRNDPVLIRTFGSFLAGFEGVSPDKLSTECCDSLYRLIMGKIQHQGEAGFKSMWVSEGNGMIAEELAKGLKKPVHLNSVLQSINKNNSGSYLLEFKNGNKVLADIVVLAIPCSVYEDISIGKNVIPLNKLKLIKSVQYGTNAKIAVPILPPKQLPGCNFNERMGISLQGHLHTVHIYLLREFGRFNADTIVETYERELPFLKKIFQIDTLETPVIAVDKSFASYSGPVGHSWPNDPYAKGSYTSIGPGQEKILAELNVIFGEQVRPLFNPVENTLFFAGEHTCIDNETRGTIEAAIESGERTARLINKMNKMHE